MAKSQILCRRIQPSRLCSQSEVDRGREGRGGIRGRKQGSLNRHGQTVNVPLHNVPPSNSLRQTETEWNQRKSAEQRFWRKHLLDDLKERPVKLGENFIAVFKLKTNVVRLHPSYVLQKREGVVRKKMQMTAKTSNYSRKMLRTKTSIFIFHNNTLCPLHSVFFCH